MNIKRFFEFEGGTTYPYRDRDRRKADVFAIMTQELSDSKSDQRHKSMAHDAYHIYYEGGLDELERLESLYPVGSKYKGETVTNTYIF